MGDAYAVAEAALTETGPSESVRACLNEIIGLAEWQSDVIEQLLRAPTGEPPGACHSDICPSCQRGGRRPAGDMAGRRDPRTSLPVPARLRQSNLAKLGAHSRLQAAIASDPQYRCVA